MSDQCTIIRDGQWFITMDGGKLKIARSEHSDWLEIDSEERFRLIADIELLIKLAKVGDQKP